MNAERWWWLALAAVAAAITSAMVTGASNLTLGLALGATGVVILALVVEGPTDHERRPW